MYSLMSCHISKCSGHTDAVLCLQFDDHKLVSGSKDTTIKVNINNIVAALNIKGPVVDVRFCRQNLVIKILLMKVPS